MISDREVRGAARRSYSILVAVAVAAITLSGGLFLLAPGGQRAASSTAPTASTAPHASDDTTRSAPNCALLHPADLMPYRSAERSWNFVCSSQHRPAGLPLSSGGGPPGFGIYNLFMAYDAHDGYLLLLGATGVGANNGTETWTYAHGTWTQLSPSTSPQSCAGSVMAYDDADGYVVYFAGANVTTGHGCASMGQTWSFANGNWTELYPATSPTPRVGAAMTNDSADGYLLLFGGMDASGVAYNDTWKFLGGSWTNLSPGTAPSPRYGAGMAFDAYDGYVLLFGGSSSAGCIDQFQNGVYCMDRDTWSFSAGVWSQLSPTGAVPPEPYDDGMIYDAGANKVLYTVTDDNWSGEPEIWWTYQSGNWTNPANNSHCCGSGSLPSNRFGETLAYDYADGYAVMFGGTAINWSWLNDTWAYNGTNWSQLSPHSVPQPTYPVAFSAYGLASYTLWSVNLSGKSISSNTGPITFNEANGTYSYTVGAVSGYTSSPSTGTVIVAGAGVVINITFSNNPISPPSYNVTFQQNGLPSGTRFTMNVHNSNYSGTTHAIVQLPNGSYFWNVTPIAGWNVSKVPDPIVVAGAPTTAWLNFTNSSSGTGNGSGSGGGGVKRTVTFTESGLASGSDWSVELDSAHASGTAGSFTFTVATGNHTYVVTGPASYAVEPSSGTLDITGNATVSVTFTAPPPEAFPVNFTEKGLPSGTAWSVLLGGVSYSSSVPWVTALRPNGTYAYEVGPIPGFSTTHRFGNLSVQGVAVATELAFSASSTGPANPAGGGANGTNYFEGVTVGLLVGALLGGGLVAGAFWVGRRTGGGPRYPPSSGGP